MSVATSISSGTWAGGVPMAPAVGAEDPPGITGWALTYIQPLQQWFDELVGDPAAVEGVAEQWTRAEHELTDIAHALQQAQSQLDSLEGRMVRTLSVRYDDLNPAALECAEWSGAIAAAARLALSVVAGTRQFILDGLYQLERLIGALFGFTLNPFDKIDEINQLIDVAAELWRVGRQFIDSMFDAFTRLIELLHSLAPVIDEVLLKLRETIALMMPIAGGIAGTILGLHMMPRIPLAGGLAPLAGGFLGTYYGGTIRDAMREIGDVTRYGDDDFEAMKQELERMKGDPNVTDEELDALEDKLLAWQEARSVKNLDSFADFVGANGTTDRMGSEDSTVFDVKLVRAEDGSEHWVVAFPSTQEWFDAGGQGAMNDGKNNLALMFHDDLQSQYERAALQAMREAGIADGDPVVFTGFSQGGIAAAKFAASDEHPYTPIGVIANGAPVDSVEVPADVPVIAFQHADDYVPYLDLNISGSDRPNFTTVPFPNHDEMPGYDPSAPGGAHSTTHYVSSIQNSPHSQALWEQYRWMGGEVIDHQLFEAVQR